MENLTILRLYFTAAQMPSANGWWQSSRHKVSGNICSGMQRRAALSKRCRTASSGVYMKDTSSPWTRA